MCAHRRGVKPIVKNERVPGERVAHKSRFGAGGGRSGRFGPGTHLRRATSDFS